MASYAPTSGLSSLLKDGTKHISGVDAAVLKNIDACTQLGTLVSTSLGPHARRKIVVNRLGKLFVTSDAATILRELEVIHPAAQLLVKAAEAQEREAGDGTAAVVILASALLENAEKMLRMGLHTSEIIAGTAACVDWVADVVRPRVRCFGVGRAVLGRGSAWWVVGYRASRASLVWGPWIRSGVCSLPSISRICCVSRPGDVVSLTALCSCSVSGGSGHRIVSLTTLLLLADGHEPSSPSDFISLWLSAT